MVSHQPPMFAGHRRCASGDVMYLMIEWQDFTCSHLNLPLLFISV